LPVLAVLLVLQVLHAAFSRGKTRPMGLQHLGVAPVLRGVASLVTRGDGSVFSHRKAIPTRCNTVQHRVLRPVLQAEPGGSPSVAGSLQHLQHPKHRKWR
jgi:hypothetical protein